MVERPVLWFGSTRGTLETVVNHQPSNIRPKDTMDYICQRSGECTCKRRDLVSFQSILVLIMTVIVAITVVFANRADFKLRQPMVSLRGWGFRVKG